MFLRERIIAKRLHLRLRQYGYSPLTECFYLVCQITSDYLEQIHWYVGGNSRAFTAKFSMQS